MPCHSLYRRHRRECKGQHLHDQRTSEYEERKKGWKRCECPIFASGTLGKHFTRYNTGQWESRLQGRRRGARTRGNLEHAASTAARARTATVLRLLQEIPLGEAEQAAVEDGIAV